MRVFQVSALTVTLLLAVAYARPQQQVDPAYLREYYQQLAARGSPTEATPIYEQDGGSPQFQQIRANPEQVRHSHSHTHIHMYVHSLKKKT